MKYINVHIVTAVIMSSVCVLAYFSEEDYKEVLLAVSAGYYGLMNSKEDS